MFVYLSYYLLADTMSADMIPNSPHVSGVNSRGVKCPGDVLHFTQICIVH